MHVANKFLEICLVSFGFEKLLLFHFNVMWCNYQVKSNIDFFFITTFTLHTEYM